MRELVVTIDGPSGSGKTTVSRLVAEHMDYAYVDTGALYRAVAVMIRQSGCDPRDETCVERVCRGLTFHFTTDKGRMRLLANGQDVTDSLRTPEITMLSSAISALAVVRTHLLQVQRTMAEGGGAVFEGRDTGTVVFPQADVKFFLEADEDTRARRRHEEMRGAGLKVTLEKVARDIRIRDRKDTERALSPLRCAPDAIAIDSTHLSVQEVVDTMVSRIQACRRSEKRRRNNNP